jgi:hypothetical protein
MGCSRTLGDLKGWEDMLGLLYNLLVQAHKAELQMHSWWA